MKKKKETPDMEEVRTCVTDLALENSRLKRELKQLQELSARQGVTLTEQAEKIQAFRDLLYPEGEVQDETN